jgi:hypothetical protein
LIFLINFSHVKNSKNDKDTKIKFSIRIIFLDFIHSYVLESAQENDVNRQRFQPILTLRALWCLAQHQVSVFFTLGKRKKAQKWKFLFLVVLCGVKTALRCVSHVCFCLWWFKMPKIRLHLDSHVDLLLWIKSCANKVDCWHSARRL